MSTSWSYSIHVVFLFFLTVAAVRMTCQRFLYKLFWRRLGIPLIFGCGLIAIVTTFYHHSKFKVVDVPPNTQKNPARAHRKEHLVHNEWAGREKYQHRNVVRDVYKGKQGGMMRKDNEVQKSADEKNNINHKQDSLAQVGNKDLQNLQFRDISNEKKLKQHQKEEDMNIMERMERHIELGGLHHEQRGKKINTEKDRSPNLEDRWQGQKLMLKPDTGKKGVVKGNNTRINEIRRPHGGVKDTKGQENLSDKQINNHQSHFVQSIKYGSHRNEKNSSLHHLDRFRAPSGVNQIDIPSKDRRNNTKSQKIIRHIKDGIAKSNSSVKEKYGIPDSADSHKFQNLDIRQSQRQDLVKVNNGGLFQEQKSRNANNDNDIIDEVHRKQIESNVIIVNPGPHDNSIAFRNLPETQNKPHFSKPETLQEFQEWAYSKQTWCSGHLSAFFNEFVYLKGVVLDKAYISGRPGGEEIKDVLNQPEEDEYYKYDLGCFQLACPERPEYFFNGGYHLSDFLFNLKTKEVRRKADEVRRQFTIVVTRYEYANIYHTMTDWYNAFLMMKFFNKTREETHILLMDAHPKGALDSAWGILFHASQRLSELKQRTLFSEMVWSTLGYDSLMLNHYLETLPLVDEFHKFFLSSFNIQTKPQVNCEHIKIVFIWRKDYLAHPRNPAGTLSRKIKNEKELLRSVRKKYPNFDVNGVQIDVFSMDKQLQMISQTDILIGMHGAGLTHAMFLPDHAGLIELVPTYWSSAMDHFMAIAQWRNLHYERWVNNDPHDEMPNESTLVPPGVVQVFIKSMLRKMKCMEDFEDVQYNDS